MINEIGTLKVFEDVLTKEIETWRSFIDKLPSDEDKVVLTTNTLMIISIGQKLIAMVVMMTCKNCGYEYESKVLQTPDEEFLIFKSHENILENCPK